MAGRSRPRGWTATPSGPADYLAGTDVVVWTPRRESGRPLTFQPLPDFGAVLDDVDEFNAAVDAAVEALAPRVGVQRASTEGRPGKGGADRGDALVRPRRRP